MRRLSRIYEPVIDSAIGRIARHHQSKYVCRSCLRYATASQLPSSTAQFTTSASRTAGLGLDKFSSAMKGETTIFDEQTPKKEEEFKPADTWEGLEWVGTKEWYEKENRPQEPFQAYGRITSPLKDRTEIRDELLKAIVEVFTIRRAAPDTWKRLLKRIAVDDGEGFPKGIRLGSDSSTNELIIEFENEEVERQFFNHLQKAIGSGVDEVAQEISEDAAAEIEASQAVPPSSNNEIFTFADLKDQASGKWSSISLENLDVRFAIAKRVQQRTGIRLTDPQLTQASTAGSMFLNLWTPEKPKKLAEGLLNDAELTGLPNVQISDHRVSFVHRERDLGRWKIIEEELTERGISPLGRPGYKKRSGKV